ncbi:hypothetical protein OUZ56_015111 [Daphnia magna]|uniref:Uncharacterized protein n=1 Tax=Daphnia magna TaxID=35525 RepID=A0ABR0ALV8_9CRUS|nr:hypothetical protein OUZ56_015111 [Daphnia magna]
MTPNRKKKKEEEEEEEEEERDGMRPAGPIHIWGRDLRPIEETITQTTHTHTRRALTMSEGQEDAAIG